MIDSQPSNEKKATDLSFTLIRALQQLPYLFRVLATTLTYWTSNDVVVSDFKRNHIFTLLSRAGQPCLRDKVKRLLRLKSQTTTILDV